MRILPAGAVILLHRPRRRDGEHSFVQHPVPGDRILLQGLGAALAKGYLTAMITYHEGEIQSSLCDFATADVSMLSFPVSVENANSVLIPRPIDHFTRAVLPPMKAAR